MAKFQFQMVAGQHIGIDPATGKERKYLQGDIIDTDVDLDAKYNTPGFPPKFVGTNPGHQGKVQVIEKFVDRVIDLGTMPLADLQAFAAEEEIDLKGAKTQVDVLKIIRDARRQQATAATA